MRQTDYDETTGEYGEEPPRYPEDEARLQEEDESGWGTLHDPPAEPAPDDIEQWKEDTKRWSYHLANDPFGGAAGAWAKQFFDNPNIDPWGEMQGRIAAWRAQYGEGTPDDDIGAMEWIATGRTPERQNQSPTDSWTNTGGGSGGDGGGGGGGTIPTVPTETPEQIQRRQQFYDLLMGRAQQGLAVNRYDPTVRAQVDPYAAQLDRQQRNYLEQIAEGGMGRPLNMQGEQRLAAERFGQLGAQFEGEVIGREVAARRREIAEALGMYGDLLSEEQRLTLQRELGYLDDATRRYGINQEMTRADRDRELEEWIARQFDDRARRLLPR